MACNASRDPQYKDIIHEQILSRVCVAWASVSLVEVLEARLAILLGATPRPTSRGSGRCRQELSAVGVVGKSEVFPQARVIAPAVWRLPLTARSDRVFA